MAKMIQIGDTSISPDHVTVVKDDGEHVTVRVVNLPDALPYGGEDRLKMLDALGLEDNHKPAPAPKAAHKPAMAHGK